MSVDNFNVSSSTDSLLPSVAVLFARNDSIYKFIPGCDVYDIERDARSYSGSLPVVAHPPCRAWGKLRKLAKPREDERDLAFFALEMVRKNGGVLEHPIHSRLRIEGNLPQPGNRDCFGGFILGVNQSWWGHVAEKSTLLYFCGIQPRYVPIIPITLDSHTRTVESLSHSHREKTPLAFAAWLVDLANRCNHAR